MQITAFFFRKHQAMLISRRGCWANKCYQRYQCGVCGTYMHGDYKDEGRTWTPGVASQGS